MASTHHSLRFACLLALSASVPQLVGAANAPTPQASPATAASKGNISVALSLEDCVARAMLKNFDLRMQDFNTANARESLNIAKADYSPVLSASASRSGSQSYLSRVDSDGLDTSVGVSQKIVTGATVDVSSGLTRSSTNPASSTLNPSYSSDVAVSISQPLLKNAGTTVNQAAIERARLGVERAGYNFRSALLTVVSGVENAYYNLCYAREQLAVRKNSLALANTLLDEAKARESGGMAIKLDVLQAQVGVANAQRNVLTAEQSVSDREDALMVLIGQFELGTAIGQVQFPAFEASTASFDISYKLARDNQPDLLAAHVAQKQYEIDTTTAKNTRLPSLDLGTSVGYNAKDVTPGRSLRQVPDGDGYNWQVGLSFRMPWGLKAENARYRSALNNSSQNRLRTQQLEQSLMADVRSAVRAVETNRQSVDISIQATLLSEEKYKMEQERFRAGSSTARRVLEAQDDLENSRISELQAKVSLRNAVSELHRLEGSSLGRYGLQLP